MFGKPRVGILKGLDIKGGYKEKQVVKKFSEHFLVTFSRTEQFKYTRYDFSFLKPQDKYRNMFNLYNEVLLLFAPFPNFNTRTFDFVDKTLSIDYPNRLDKICVMLVSSDPLIEKKIEQLNRENRESKIIVPFNYDEILENKFSTEVLEAKLRKYFYSRDLFALESPLKSENYFYGRNHVVQQLYDKYCLGEHAGLFGLRKVGKTSVLFGLERMIKLRQGCSIYIDCQDTAVHKSTWNELLFKIIKNLKEKYNLDLETMDCKLYTDKYASESFEKDLKLIKSNLPSNPRVLLIFDEIEHISFNTSTSIHWRQGMDYIYFWQTLRAIYQKNTDLISFIIAGVNPTTIEQPRVFEFDNPIFSLIKPIFLDLFTVEHVTEMVRSIGKYMGLKFDSEIFTYLTEGYGGHPFLIRHVCSLMNKDLKGTRPIEVSKYLYREKKEEYDQRIQHYVQLIIDVLKTWYEEEYRLLEVLVSEGSEKFMEEVRYKANIIQHLIGYGIVKEANKKYYITINAVENFIKSFIKKKGETPKTKDEKWATISVRRNRLEEKLRIIVLMILKSHYGKKTKKQLLEVIEEKRATNIKDLDFNTIFKNHLYFSDIKKLVLKHWSFFEKIFKDRVKFENYMDFINKYRIDAHSKDISDEDYGILMIALDWIEKIVKDIEIG